MLGSTCLNTISCFALVVANFSHLSPILKRITYLSPNKTLLCFFTPSPTPSASPFRTPWASSCSSSARKSLCARPVHHEDVGEERAWETYTFESKEKNPTLKKPTVKGLSQRSGRSEEGGGIILAQGAEAFCRAMLRRS